MKDLVQPEARIDIARKFIRLRYDRLERGPHECVAVRLTPSQCAGITAEKRQVRSEFLAKRHR